jgi:hypothetical protein
MSRLCSSTSAESVINYQLNTVRAVDANSHGAAAGHRVSGAMGAMREWLNCKPIRAYEVKIKSARQSLFPLCFWTIRRCEAFARRFDRKEPAGPTPPDV